MSEAWHFSPMPRAAPPVNLTESDRQELERWVSAHHTAQQDSQRCRIVLAAAQDQQDKLIADDLDLDFRPSPCGGSDLSARDLIALDRTQPGLPLKKGRCGTMTQGSLCQC